MQRCAPKLIATLLLISAIATAGYAEADLPMPRHYVEDYANVINASDERSLNGILQELEQKTGAQYIVLTVLTTGGLPIEQFALEHAEKWKLGRKGKDEAMLFVFAAKERQARFEVGYGLEGFITDQYTNRVGRNVLLPYIKQRNISRGIYEANLQIAQSIATENGVTLSGMPKLKPLPVRQRRRLPFCGAVPMLLLMLLLFGGFGRGMGWWFLLPFMLGGFGGHGGYGRSGSFGGGSFGGGFGGFGGGMGGSFGGGGSTVSW